jgi:hypothetical protein
MSIGQLDDKSVMRHAGIGNEAFLLRLSWGNTDHAVSGRLAVTLPHVFPALWRR